MKINEKKIKTIPGIDKKAIVLFLLAVQHEDQFPGMMNLLLDREFLTEEEDSQLRMTLLYYNEETEKFSIKFPLYTYESSSGFDAYIKEVSKSIPQNRLGLLSVAEDTKISFQSVLESILNEKESNNSDTDTREEVLQNLVNATIMYYQSAEFPKGLGRYISENILIDYNRNE